MAGHTHGQTPSEHQLPRELDELMPLAYEELRALARRVRRLPGDRKSLDATDLVHEAYMRLIGQDEVAWKSHTHVLAVAAVAMRRLLVDEARGRRREKRGGGWQRVMLSADLPVDQERDLDLLALDDCLRKLEESDSLKVRIIELRYFGGLSLEQIAEDTGRSLATVKRHLTVARGWLHRELTRTHRSHASSQPND